MYIQVLGRSLPFPLAVANDRHDLAPRAALPADSPSPSEPSSLLPLLALTLVFVLVVFALTRLFKRFNPSFSFGLRLPNYRWLRGKGQGAKGRLGLVGVELLPTSVKSIPMPSPSPRVGVFAGSSNVGKDSDTSGLLSRSSSLDTLPQYPDTATLPPTASFPVHARQVGNPFKFSIFPASKYRNRGKSASHRRSKSLNAPIRHLAVPSSPLASINGGSSVPTTPSPQALLIDFSSSSESASSGDSYDTTSSKGPSSSSSDLGTHRFSPGSDGPLIPIPIPAHHIAPTSTSPIWAFDLDIEDDLELQPTNPLMQAFKRSQGPSASKPTSQIPLIVYDSSSIPTRSASLPDPAQLSSPSSHYSNSSHTPSTAEFPLTPPGLSKLARVGDHVRMAALEPSPDRSNALPSPISSDIELGSIPSQLPASSNLQKSVEELVDLETGDQDIELVDISVSPSEPAQLVGFSDEIKINTVPAAVSEYNMQQNVGTSVSVPEIRTSPIVQDSSYLVPPSNFGPLEHLGQSGVSDEPVLVTVEPPTPSPFIELSLVDVTTPINEYEVPEVSKPTIAVPTVVTPISPSSSPPCEERLVELVDVPVLHSGQVSPVGTMEAWSLDDDWNYGIDHENVEPHRLPDNDTAEVGPVPHDPIPQYIMENVVVVADEVVDEEAWFTEEVTIVWPEEEMTDTPEAVKEKIVQEVDPVPDTDFEEPESSMRPTHVFEPDMLMQQKLEVHEAPEASNHDDDHAGENDEINDNIMITTILEPLPLPLITISTEDFPDPDLLPLPSKPVSPTHKPEYSYPSQTPTPPASPPVSPSRSLPASALSSPNTASPVTLPSSTASTPTSTRPAWSLRASDAPALGLPSPSSLKQKSSPDLRSRNRLLSAVVEEQASSPEGSTVHPASDLVSVEDDTSIKDEVSPETNIKVQDEGMKANEQISETVISELSTALPGSFPVSQSPETTLDSPTPVASSTALAPATTPRRRGTRSPLDIALAMQLRPGLGLGADPAWMVRFLMSMFGWFAILLSGQAEFDGYRNGSYPIDH